MQPQPLPSTHDDEARDSTQDPAVIGSRVGSQEELVASNETIVPIPSAQDDKIPTKDRKQKRGLKWRSESDFDDIESQKPPNQLYAKTKEQAYKTATKTSKTIKEVIKEFFAFLGDGRIMDYAIGMVIGTAFTTVINSLVTDLISPFIGLAIGKQLENLFIVLKAPPATVCQQNSTMCDFHTPADALKVGAVSWNLGNFLQTALNFFMVAIALFAVIKGMKGIIKTTKQQVKNLKQAPQQISQSLTNLKGLVKKKGRSSRGTEGRTSEPKPSAVPPGLGTLATHEEVSHLEIHGEDHPAEHNAAVTDYNEGKYLAIAMPGFLKGYHRGSELILPIDDLAHPDHTPQPSYENTPQHSPGFLHKHHFFHAHAHHQEMKECPFCLSNVPGRARRCAFCTSVLEPPLPRDDAIKKEKGKSGSAKEAAFNMQFGSVPFKI